MDGELAGGHSRMMQELNRRIYAMQRQETHLQDADYAEFVCECEDEECTETVRLTLREYAARPAGKALVAPSHGEDD
jgi:hypothetical protein